MKNYDIVTYIHGEKDEKPSAKAKEVKLNADKFDKMIGKKVTYD